ncbi:hypothetical protein [Vibrio phage VP41s3]|nr:hypothetical protein [Vibrio phage VP41s3]
MSTIKLTKRMTAEIVSANTVKVVTNQVVAGGGDKNLVIWALEASKRGYKTMLVEINAKAPRDVVEAIRKRIRNANEMINHLGLEVREA